VLVVEDDAMQRRALARFLARWGFEPEEAEDGGVAIRKVSEATNCFALVMLDIMLPVCDGLEVARYVRARWPDQPILACSAAFNEDVIDDLRRLDVQDLLYKPYVAETLRTLVDHLAALNAATGVPEPDMSA
jgi:two-component system response regulator ResD